MRRFITVISIAWIGWLPMLVRAQEAPPVVPVAATPLELAIPDLVTRLSSLSPARPESYYQLGEDVADVAVEESERALARRLFLIALDTWRSRGQTREAASACIALTTVVSTDRDRRWLQAVARSLDPRFAIPSWEPVNAVNLDPAVAYHAATALGAARAGDGVAARQLLSDPAVLLALERFDAVLQPAGGVTRVQRDANVWPCPECRNRRVSRSRVPGDPAEMICASCKGDPGPRMRDSEIVAHLRLESLLLSGVHESWAAQLVADDGAPLRDPNPAAVSSTLGFDTRASLFRDGQWIAPVEPAPSPRPASADGTS